MIVLRDLGVLSVLWLLVATAAGCLIGRRLRSNSRRYTKTPGGTR